MVYKFTNRAEKAIEMAQEIAAELGHNYVGTEHLLCGLMREGSGLAYKVLANQGVTEEKIIEMIEELIGRGEPLDELPEGYTPRTKRVFEISFMEAKRLNNNYIGTEHILLGIMKEGDSVAVRIIMDLGVDIQKMFSELLKTLTEENAGNPNPNAKSKQSYNQTPTLNQFGKDLTNEAIEGKLDPIIGRENEIERIILENDYSNLRKPTERKFIPGLAELLDKAETAHCVDESKIVALRKMFGLPQKKTTSELELNVPIETEGITGK